MSLVYKPDMTMTEFSESACSMTWEEAERRFPQLITELEMDDEAKAIAYPVLYPAGGLILMNWDMDFGYVMLGESDIICAPQSIAEKKLYQYLKSKYSALGANAREM